MNKEPYILTINKKSFAMYLSINEELTYNKLEAIVFSSKLKANNYIKRNLEQNNYIKLLTPIPYNQSIVLCPLCFYENKGEKQECKGLNMFICLSNWFSHFKSKIKSLPEEIKQ